MLVELLVSMGGDRFSHKSGDVIDVPADEAERLIARQMAKPAPKGAEATVTRGPTFSELPHGNLAGESTKSTGANEPPSSEDAPRAPADPAAEVSSQTGGGKGKGKGKGNTGNAPGKS